MLATKRVEPVTAPIEGIISYRKWTGPVAVDKQKLGYNNAGNME